MSNAQTFTARITFPVIRLVWKQTWRGSGRGWGWKWVADNWTSMNHWNSVQNSIGNSSRRRSPYAMLTAWPTKKICRRRRQARKNAAERATRCLSMNHQGVWLSNARRDSFFWLNCKQNWVLRCRSAVYTRRRRRTRNRHRLYCIEYIRQQPAAPYPRY